MNIFYQLGTRAYFTGIALASAFGHRKARQMQQGRRDWAARLEQSMRPLQGRRVIWFHAASLGEFEQGRPLIEALRVSHPEYAIVQTFFSPSGYEVRKGYKGADVVCYLPYDRPAECRRFLDLVHPDHAIFVKYEFWANILEELHRRQVPTYLVSGIFRRRQAFFRWYGSMLRPVLRCFTHLFVQDEESRQLLAGIGVTNVTICGDTRFDRVIAIQQQAKPFPWAAQFAEGAPFVLVAGSSWPKDEDIVIDHFNRHPEMKLIIAPHEIHDAHVQQILSKLQRPCLCYSELRRQWEDGRLPEGQLPTGPVDCLVIDAIGFLSGIYRYGHAAYIGGGFGVGIHNTLEAAVYGIPVVFGPNHQAFREALGLIAAQGGFAISDAATYDTVMSRFMTDAAALHEAGDRAGAYVRDNSGATDTIFSAVFGR